jgi:hypothetical protein
VWIFPTFDVLEFDAAATSQNLCNTELTVKNNLPELNFLFL